ncbi:MAG: flippase-like domain-containing protein [Bdellovibrionales bacterium]|nr:flippase-like domain-containing protein [Bdellovibrionales bacterium]
MSQKPKARSTLLKLFPWVITIVACYIAFKEVNWDEFFMNLRQCDPSWLLVALVATAMSYLLRSYRWLYFFPKPVLSFADATRVLILGFFMNNILPARTGEFVRAHMGASITKEKRTLVLATIASERLIDGLVLSFMFVFFVLMFGSQHVSVNLTYVVALFVAAGLGVLFVLKVRHQLYPLITAIGNRFNSKLSGYAVDRFEVFVEGLAPIASLRRFPIIALSSIAVWFVELLVFWCVTESYDIHLGFTGCVVFLVTVNFSSLIPAAPGGVGVIEAVTAHVLIQSLGVARELALPMVLTQHVIQYLVVGIPGALIMLTWKQRLSQLQNHENGQATPA